jgi:broad specificity phosphatase PhoE
MTIYFIRHAESLANEYYKNSNYTKYLDKIDCNLSQYGYIQSNSNIINLSNISKIYVSPLTRTLETLQGIIKNNNNTFDIDIIVEPLLTEIITELCDIGHSRKYLENNFPEFNFEKLDYNSNWWYSNNNNAQQIEPEPYENLILRCNKFIDIIKNNDNKNILIIGHADWFNEFYKIYTKSIIDIWLNNFQMFTISVSSQELS